MTPQRMGKLNRLGPAGAAVLTAALLGGCGSIANQAELPNAAGNAVTPSSPAPAPAPEPASRPSPAAESSAEPAAEPATEPAREQAQAQPSRVERCHTSMLSGNVQRGEPGAGQRYAELVLTNTSGETCTLYGYGGMQLIDENGDPLPTDVERTPSPGPEVVRLAPGDSASATLHWTAVPHQGEPTDGPCQPRPASAQVIPPDETDPLTVSWQFGPVCGFGSIDGSAYHA